MGLLIDSGGSALQTPSYGGLRSPPKKSGIFGPRSGRMKVELTPKSPANLMVLDL